MLNYIKLAIDWWDNNSIRTSIKHGSINPWTENIRNQNVSYETNSLQQARVAFAEFGLTNFA
jgi:hypothetical protein